MDDVLDRTNIRYTYDKHTITLGFQIWCKDTMKKLGFANFFAKKMKKNAFSQVLISLRSNDYVNFGKAKFTFSQIHTSV